MTTVTMEGTGSMGRKGEKRLEVLTKWLGVRWVTDALEAKMN